MGQNIISVTGEGTTYLPTSQDNDCFISALRRVSSRFSGGSHLDDALPYVSADKFFSALGRAMQASGVCSLRYSYNGSGDEGASFLDCARPVAVEADGVASSSFKSSGLDELGLKGGLEDILTKFVDTFIETVDSGYEDNTGGGGTVSFTVDGGFLNFEWSSFYNEIQKEWLSNLIAVFPYNDGLPPVSCVDGAVAIADKDDLADENDAPLSLAELSNVRVNSRLVRSDSCEKAVRLVGREMAACDLASISVEFGGSGDEGSITDVSIEQAEGVTLTPQGKQTHSAIKRDRGILARTLRNLADDLINHLASGYEDDEGGGGCITFSAHTDHISVRFRHYRCEETAADRDQRIWAFPIAA